MRQHPFFEQQVRAMIDLAEQRLSLFYRDIDNYKEIIVNNSPYLEDYAKKNLEKILFTGAISLKIMNALLKDEKNNVLGTMDFMWDCLIKSRIFISTFQTISIPGLNDLTHRLDSEVLKDHIAAGTFQNIFAPPSALLQTYREALLSIDVEKNGVERRGSGFIVQRDKNSLSFVVTCLHNVDPSENIRISCIRTSSGRDINISEPIPIKHLDLCLFMIVDHAPDVAFRLKQFPNVFDEVYTIGYPNIPGTQPVLVGHRGEINALTDSYLQTSPLIIISNLVSPGSSGCPVLSNYGRCVGMTISSPEGITEGGMQINFSAALPAVEIWKYICILESQVNFGG